MFLLDFVKRWWASVEAIYQEVNHIEDSLRPFSQQAIYLLPRLDLIKFVAAVPPLAHYLRRKLISIRAQVARGFFLGRVGE